MSAADTDSAVRLALVSFLASRQRTPFAWGRHDCCLFIADWVQLQIGRDPAAAYRGTYSDEAGCDAIVKAAGGLPELVGQCARACGLRETGAPRLGDIGLIEGVMPNGETTGVGAICAGRRWVALTLRQGLIGAVTQPIVCWSVPCRR